MTPENDVPTHQDTWRDRLLYWLVMAGVVLFIVLLLLMTFEASIINFSCFLTDFLMGKCARWGRWW